MLTMTHKKISKSRVGDPICDIEMLTPANLKSEGWKLESKISMRTDKESETINALIGCWPVNKTAYCVSVGSNLQLVWVEDWGTLVFANYVPV